MIQEESDEESDITKKSAIIFEGGNSFSDLQAERLSC